MKSARFDVRLTEPQKADIIHAANDIGISVNQFIREAANARAQGVEALRKLATRDNNR